MYLNNLFTGVSRPVTISMSSIFYFINKAGDFSNTSKPDNGAI